MHLHAMRTKNKKLIPAIMWKAFSLKPHVTASLTYKRDADDIYTRNLACTSSFN